MAACEIWGVQMSYPQNLVWRVIATLEPVTCIQKSHASHGHGNDGSTNPDDEYCAQSCDKGW